MIKETYMTMTYQEFDEMASKLLGRPYSFVQENEANNYSSYEFYVGPIDLVSFATEYTEDDGPHGILTALVLAGELEFGNFLVQVGW